MQIDLLKALQRISHFHNMQLIEIESPFEELEKFDYGLRKTLNPEFDFAQFGQQILDKMPENALVITRDFSDFRYALFTLPDEKGKVYLYGPWIAGLLKQEQQELLKASFSEAQCEVILECRSGVRMFSERTEIMALCALIGTAYEDGTFQVRDWPDFLPDFEMLERAPVRQWTGRSEMSLEFAAERNRIEDAIVNAVMQGNLEAAILAANQLHRYAVREWTTNPLRNFKVYLLAANAHLSKAVVKGSVHPLYAEQIYDRFVNRIEGIETIRGGEELIYEMLKDYCACVREHTLKDFSPLVQRVINHINLNLDMPLSLKSLAELCCISPSYLSNLFKAETGTTLTDHITRQRIQRAAYLLENESCSVAQVGVQVGFLDDNYFTRTFKKIMGMPPTAYRKKHQK